MPSDAVIRVLIVDDELQIRELSKEFLDEFNGIEVEVAASAREARRIHARMGFDVIVSDYQMPEEDGIQFLKSLRASGDRTPFILFTGKGREEVVIEALNNDADSYLQKGGHPLPLYTELEHRIRVVVGKRQAESALKTNLKEMQRANEELATAEEELRAQIDEIKASNEELRVKDERLRLNEVRLDNLFENMSSGAAVHAIILDPSGAPYDYRFLNVNHAFEKMTGLKRSAILGRTVREVLHQVEPIWIERYGRVALTGLSDHFESHSAALERDYSVSVYQNDPGQFTTLLLDITERARAEKAERELSIKYQTLMRTLPIGVTISDDRGNIIESNKEAERLLGLSEEEQKRRSIAGEEWKIIRSDGTPMPPEEFASTIALAKGHTIQNVEMGLVEGEQLTWISVAAAPIPLEGHGVAIAYSDITGLKQAEEQLKRTNAFLNNLLDYANAPIIVWDPRMRITIFNHAFERLTGLKAESMIGQGLDSLFPKESRERSRALLQQTSTGHRWEVVEIPIQAQDGSVRTVLWNSATLTSPQGEIIATIAQGQDITERKRVENTLLESERRFKGLFDTMGSGVAIYAVRNDGEKGADYIIQDFNHRALEIEGKSKKEVVGRSLSDLRPNIDSYGIIPIFRQVWNTGQTAFYPAKVYIDEQYVNWYENTVFRLPSGEIVAIYNDVTERKRAEEELKLKDSAVASSINAIAIADLSGNLTYINPAFLKIWGYEDRQEVIGRSALSFWKDPEEAQRTIEGIQSQGKWSGEMEGRRRDGTSIHVQLLANLIRDDSDNPVAMMASFVDITERKRAEMEIRQTKEQLEEANHLARIGTWDWITETDSVLWSDELFRIAGRDSSLPAPSFADQPQYYTPASWSILNDAVKVTLDNHEPYHLELEMVRPDGSVREVIAIGTVKYDLMGQIIGLHGTVQDITERKRAEEALHEANRKLNLLSSTTRHDLNNQITTLAGNLFLLKKNRPQLASDEHLRKVEKAAEQLSATILFTKNYEDIGVKAPAWASIGRQTEEAFALLRPVGAELKLDTKGVEVLADPLLEKIPYNLIDNSMRHGERVTHIKMSAEQRGDAVLVVYEDDGVGIDEDDKKRIFQKGFGKNTGFGLFLCREILAITGITITETGKAGEGVRFEMLVPAGSWRFSPIDR